MNAAASRFQSDTRVMQGLIAAPYSPFDPRSGDLNLAIIEKYCASLVASGVTGAFVCGTTGEGVSMTIDERMAVAQRWVEVAGKSLNVIVHVGDCCQRNSMTLAAHAARIGAAGTAAMPAFFLKPSGAAQVVEFCQPIAAASGDLPFFYYHIPSMNGVAVSVVDLLTIARERIPNLRGVKYTHGDMMEFQRCMTMHGDVMELAWGVDEMLIGALGLGAQAAVGSTYNYAAPLYHKMINAHEAGDMETARACSSTVCEMVAVLLKHGVLRTGKATMAMIGVDVGTPRPPVTPLIGDELATVRGTYERVGAFKFAEGRSVASNGAMNGVHAHA